MHPSKLLGGYTPYLAALTLLSVIYYSAYIMTGFNFTDDGSYAQICYELFLGRDAHDIALSYGVLWFKLGEMLFQLFGVNYLLIKILFFTCITFTTLLVFYTVALATNNRAFAVLMAAVPLLVPAFPATAFYGLCVMMNVAAQMRLACRAPGASNADTAIAGVALSVAFQIRADFGYAFAVPLILILFLNLRARRSTLFFAAGAGFIIAQLPILIAAAAGGYIDIIMSQYFDYPLVVLSFVLVGVRGLVENAPPNAAGTVLRRPGLTALLQGDLLAQLVYLPIAVLFAFVVFNLIAWMRGHRERLAQTIVAVFAAGATLPHYFLYRPDMSHIANFMPGYVILIAAFIWQIYKSSLTTILWRQRAAVIGVILLVANLGLYVGAGLTSIETGSIGMAAGRTERFQASNGVDVLVSADEKAELTALRDVIEQNSPSGAAILCYPYCPGIAFMTARRLPMRHFFVDDSVPLRDPSWLADAATQARETKPSVVVVMDWAINGTDMSRFDVWAAPYVAALKEMAREQRVLPGIAIYLL
jgi:hypothetical protein